MPWPIVGPTLMAAGSALFTALIGIAFFRQLQPTHVANDYAPCCEGWHEAQLRGCKQGLLYVPQQPINTYSNITYMAAGIFVGGLIGTAPAWGFALAMAYLCVGSMLFHAVSTNWGQMLDVTGIYAVFSALAAYAAAELAQSGLEAAGSPGWLTSDWTVATVMFAIAGGVVYVFGPRFREDMEQKIALFLVPAYVLTLLNAFHVWPLVVGSIALFAVAYLCWWMDKKRTFPIVPWGHGAWHLFTAAATGLAFYAAYLGGQ